MIWRDFDEQERLRSLNARRIAVALLFLAVTMLLVSLL